MPWIKMIKEQNTIIELNRPKIVFLEEERRS